MVLLQSLTLLFLALIVLLVSLLSTPILLLKMFLSFMEAFTVRHGQHVGIMPIEGFCGFLLGVWDGNMIRHVVADFVVPMAMFGAMCIVIAEAEDKTLNPFALVLSQVVIITVGDRLIHLLTGRN